MNRRKFIKISFILGFSFLVFGHQLSTQSLLTWLESTFEEFSDSYLEDVVITNSNGGEVFITYPIVKTKNDSMDLTVKRFVDYDGSGNYVKSWFENDNVYVQKYSSDGTELSTQIQVSNGNGYEGSVGQSHVAMMHDGPFIVVWVDGLHNDDNYDMYGQVFSKENNKVGTNFKINEDRNIRIDCPIAFANDIDEHFGILFTKNFTKDSSKIYLKKINKNGEEIGESTPINEYYFKFQNLFSVKYEYVHAVDVDKEGNIVVAWEAAHDDYPELMNIYTRSFDNNYQPISEIIMVNDDAHMTRLQPDVCFDENSNFLVVWADERERESRSDPRELNIYGQVYELNGIAIRKNFRVNEPVNLEDREPDIDFFNGAFSVSWNSWNESIRIDETYVNHWQYNPKISGTMISSIFNSGPGGSDYLYLSWDEYLAQNTSIYFKIRSANSLVGIDNEDWYGISDTSNYYTNSSGEIINPIHNGDRFIQYKAFFHSSTPAVTPVLNSVSISYTTLDTIPPSVPINLSAQAGHSSVILTWEANSEVDLSNYKIYRTTQSGSYESPWIKEVSGNLTGFTDSSVVSGGTYYYKISAVDSSYNESELSDEIISKPFGIQIFVSPTGSDGGDGSIMDPYQKISDAIEISLYGDEVMVLPGIYSESIVMKKAFKFVFE